MAPHTEEKYLWLLDSNCKAALKSYNRMRENTGDAAAVIADAQHFLSDVARISRTLWPGNSKFEERAFHLRQILRVQDKGSNLEARYARNNFEHLDERLSTWADTNPDPDLAMNIVGRRSDYSRISDEKLFGFYDLEIDLLVVCGERYSLRPILYEVFRLHETVLERMATLLPRAT